MPRPVINQIFFEKKRKKKMGRYKEAKYIEEKGGEGEGEREKSGSCYKKQKQKGDSGRSAVCTMTSFKGKI